MPNLIKLPSERVEQLRTLSKNLDMSIADCIAMFIHEQIEKGNLEREVPGLEVRTEPQSKTLTLNLDNVQTVLTKDAAEQLSKSIRAMLTPSKDNPFLPLSTLGLTRRGTSFKLFDRQSGTEKTIAPSIAEDLASNLEKAAKN